MSYNSFVLKKEQWGITEMKLIRFEKMCTPKPERGDIPFKQFIVLKHSLTALN